MPLQFKQESIMLHNNKEVVLKRLKKLKGRLKSDSKYKTDYLAFMSDIISRRHTEKIPAEEFKQIIDTCGTFRTMESITQESRER